jgi:hypothetical protein
MEKNVCQQALQLNRSALLAASGYGLEGGSRSDPCPPVKHSGKKWLLKGQNAPAWGRAPEICVEVPSPSNAVRAKALADPSSLACSRMSSRVGADPSIVHGFVGTLVP